MGWGAMMGLGQGLQQFGGVLMERNKAKVAADLEDKRQANKDAIEKAKQDRLDAKERATIDPDLSTPTKGADGVWMTKYRNKFGDVLDERLTDSATVQDLTNKETTNKLTLDHLAHQATQDKLEEKYGERSIQATIAAKEAEAGRTQSYTDLNTARAAHVGDVKPTSYKPTAPPKYTQPSKASVEAYFTGDNAKKKASFEKWRADQIEVDPAFNNGEYALDQFKNGNSAATEQDVNGTRQVVPAGYTGTVQALSATILEREKAGKPRPTHDELVTMAKNDYAGHGINGKVGVKPSYPRVPEAAVVALRKNPALRAQFEAKYGKAAADAILKGK